MDNYNVTAEVHTRDLEHLVDQLARYSAAAGPIAGGWTSVTVTVPATDLEQAVQTTLAVLSIATGAAAVRRLEVMPTADFDRRHGVQPLPELVSVTEAAAALGTSRQAVLQRLEAGTLPGRKVGKTWVVPTAALPA